MTTDWFQRIRFVTHFILISSSNITGDFELNSSLQKRLHSLFLSLPRVMNSASEDTKLAHLNIIKGYLIIFGASFENFLCSPSHSKTLFSALIQVCMYMDLISLLLWLLFFGHFVPKLLHYELNFRLSFFRSI